MVGATRLSVAESAAPDAPIPVEWTAVTNAQGDYRFDLDETQAGMDRLPVFTSHHLVFNELYGAVDASGIVPRSAPRPRGWASGSSTSAPAGGRR